MYLRNFRLDRYQQKALAVELYLYIEDLNTCEDHIVVDVTVLGMSQRNHWKWIWTWLCLELEELVLYVPLSQDELLLLPNAKHIQQRGCASHVLPVIRMFLRSRDITIDEHILIPDMLLYSHNLLFNPTSIDFTLNMLQPSFLYKGRAFNCITISLVAPCLRRWIHRTAAQDAT